MSLALMVMHFNNKAGTKQELQNNIYASVKIFTRGGQMRPPDSKEMDRKICIFIEHIG